MISFKDFISETSSHGTGSKTHDINVTKRMFPELLGKKKKKLSLAQKIQHRRQRDRAKGALTIDNKHGSISINEDFKRGFTIVNPFSGVKYKNVQMAHPSRGVRLTKPHVIHHQYNLKRPVKYYSEYDLHNIDRKQAKFKRGFKSFINAPISIAKGAGKVASKIGDSIEKTSSNIASGAGKIIGVAAKRAGKTAINVTAKGIGKAASAIKSKMQKHKQENNTIRPETKPVEKQNSQTIPSIGVEQKTSYTKTGKPIKSRYRSAEDIAKDVRSSLNPTTTI